MPVCNNDAYEILMNLSIFFINFYSEKSPKALDKMQIKRYNYSVILAHSILFVWA